MRAFNIYISGFLAIIVASIIPAAMGNFTLATLIAEIATPLYVLIVCLWVVFIDSKKRWPNKNAFMRYAYLITFKR